MKAINPATEEPAGEYPDHTDEQLRALLCRAGEAFRGLRTTPMPRRSDLMRRAGAVLRGRTGEFAALMTREMGKPIAQSEAEVEKCAACCDYFAEHAARYLAGEAIATDADRSYVRFDPLGAVLAIMPWNFPFWQVFRFAVPALMAGNVGLLKHAPNVPGCALAIEDVFRDAGFPTGVFSALLVDAAEVEGIIHHPAVAAVTLTGSTRAGMAVAAQAGRALKKTVLELGGSDPFIVIPPEAPESLDFLHTAARAAGSARCINSGQSCIAAKRFIVVGGTDPFEQELAAVMSAMKVGDPTDRSVEIGPLARLDLLENLDSQVQRSIQAGARLLTGGHRLPSRGFFYAPTVLCHVRPGMPAFDEETFGPVAAVIAARDVDEAVELANRSPFGLGASVWTRDLELAGRLAERIDAGSVFVNGAVKSDSRLPFGGIKQSGYGRELAAFGIREFVNVKTVWIKRGESAEGVQRSE
jgi:succinate-semialdehyde dehydrogenase / glutarate-semialdehyde dehydrogenase